MVKLNFKTLLVFLVFLMFINAAFALSESVYLVKSHSKSLKYAHGVRHEFDVGFTTKLSSVEANKLRKQNIELEEVPLQHILAKGRSTTTRLTPSDQTPWGVEKIYNDPLLTSTSGGLGVDVAVLDTGAKVDHPDLKNRVAQCKDFTKGLLVRNGCKDDNGHGTHVSGTILADAGSDGKGVYGVAPQAKLFAYKVCDSSGSCWSDDIAAAIDYAGSNGVEVISMSLGSDVESSLIRDAISRNSQVLIVAAAGNDGSALGSIDYPGANANIVAVGAIDVNENVADWSSRGINDGDYLIEEREVEFGAPGVNVESTWNTGGYRVLSGTSMATPHVSGLAAKLWQGSALLTRAYLQERAKLHDLDSPGDDAATGFGLPTVG